MINSESPEAKETAEKYKEEMGTIGGVLNGYKGKWISSRKIKEDYPNFVKDTKDLFSALGDRVARENDILYPLFDKI